MSENGQASPFYTWMSCLICGLLSHKFIRHVPTSTVIWCDKLSSKVSFTKKVPSQMLCSRNTRGFLHRKHSVLLWTDKCFPRSGNILKIAPRGKAKYMQSSFIHSRHTSFQALYTLTNSLETKIVMPRRSLVQKNARYTDFLIAISLSFQFNMFFHKLRLSVFSFVLTESHF